MRLGNVAMVVFVLGAGACAQKRSDVTPAPPGAAEPAASADDPVQAQIAAGAKLYGAHCASCHGDAGQGGGAPALVGAGALPGTPPEDRKHRKGTFATVADIAAFVDETMPPGDPSAVSAEDVWAILAFDLSANEIELDAPLGAEAAATIEIPAGGL